MAQTVLKGRISYTEGEIEYIWHTEDGACEKCQALNGLTFKNTDEIPDKPHPNCRCWIEVSDRKDNDYQDFQEPPEDDELCDCWKFFDEIEEIIGDAKSLENEMETEQNDIISFINSLNGNIKKHAQNEINKLLNCFDKITSFIKAVQIFKSNYTQLLAMKNGAYDKYYHSKANCEAAQLGYNGEQAARFLSDSKENFDIFVKGLLQVIKTKRSYKEEILKKIIDGEDDQKANQEGREMGKNFPDGICGDMLEYKKPQK